MILNLNNITEIVLCNTQLRKLFPDFNDLFKDWLACPTSKNFPMKFLESLKKEDIDKISLFFKEEICVEKIDSAIIKNLEISIENLDNVLNQYEGFGNFTICRNKKEAKVCFWR